MGLGAWNLPPSNYLHMFGKSYACSAMSNELGHRDPFPLPNQAVVGAYKDIGGVCGRYLNGVEVLSWIPLSSTKMEP